MSQDGKTRFFYMVARAVDDNPVIFNKHCPARRAASPSAPATLPPPPPPARPPNTFHR
jgi:hypothetical protein